MKWFLFCYTTEGRFGQIKSESINRNNTTITLFHPAQQGSNVQARSIYSSRVCCRRKCISFTWDNLLSTRILQSRQSFIREVWQRRSHPVGNGAGGRSLYRPSFQHLSRGDLPVIPPEEPCGTFAIKKKTGGGGNPIWKIFQRMSIRCVFIQTVSKRTGKIFG